VGKIFKKENTGKLNSIEKNLEKKENIGKKTDTLKS